MRPHPDDFHDSLAAEDVVDQAMVDVDAAGERARQVSDQLFEWRRSLERIGRRISISASALGLS